MERFTWWAGELLLVGAVARVELGSKKKTSLFFRLNFSDVQVVDFCFLQSLQPRSLLTTTYRGLETCRSLELSLHVPLTPASRRVKSKSLIKKNTIFLSIFYQKIKISHSHFPPRNIESVIIPEIIVNYSWLQYFNIKWVSIMKVSIEHQIL